jgi:hypothetical protein
LQALVATRQLLVGLPVLPLTKSVAADAALAPAALAATATAAAQT